MNAEQRGIMVKRSGPLALVQDAGRYGVRHLGVTQSGAVDWISLRWANWLLGNPLDSAALEVTMGGLTLEIERPTRLALAGADLDAHLDERPLKTDSSFTVRTGQQLLFRRPRAGLRAYLAFPGGLDAPLVLGSRACTVREQLGGLHDNGRPLQDGDRLTWPGKAPGKRQLPKGQGPRMPTAGSRLALVPGAQMTHFSGTSLNQAFRAAWQVDSRADRMGVRLTGPPLRYTLGQMVSEGVPLGAVQVPADGQPIVLLNDRQTIGGYPRLGALTPSSCATLSQCLPGTTVYLIPLRPEQAQEAHMRQLALWE